MISRDAKGNGGYDAAVPRLVVIQLKEGNGEQLEIFRHREETLLGQLHYVHLASLFGFGDVCGEVRVVAWLEPRCSGTRCM